MEAYYSSAAPCAVGALTSPTPAPAPALHPQGFNFAFGIRNSGSFIGKSLGISRNTTTYINDY